MILDDASASLSRRKQGFEFPRERQLFQPRGVRFRPRAMLHKGPPQRPDGHPTRTPRVARKDGTGVKLYSRPGNDLTYRFRLIVEAQGRVHKAGRWH